MPPPRTPPALPGARLLRVALRLTAALTSIAGVLYATGEINGWPGRPGPLPPAATIATVALLTALAQLLQMRIRAGGQQIGFAWGEAAVVIACYWLPIGLIPAVAGVGVLAGRLVQISIGRYPVAPGRNSTSRVGGALSRAIDNVCALSLSAAAAAAVLQWGGLHPHPPLQPHTTAVLMAAALAYCAVSMIIVSAQLAVGTRRLSYWPLLWQMSWSKLPMAVGNIALSIAALAAISVDPWWALALPPVLWLLHQTYTYRLRTDDERRTWQVFAATTRELNHLDERQAAVAGLRGANVLFNTTTAEIVVDGPPGPPRAYTLDIDDSVTRTEPPVLLPLRPVATHPLLVGGMRVGELRMHRSARLRKRDGLVLAAYGDALAAVIHDAATNSELRTLAERNSYDAEHDTLTGLANRAALLLRGMATLRALEPTAPVALLLLDINHFKEVNTTLGHAAGDELLRIAARRLASGGLAGELVARLGGDEFAVLLTSSGARLPHALARARDLAEALAIPVEVAGLQLSVEASVGVVATVAGDADMTELLRRADIAMYQAKRDGSSVAWYAPDADDASTDRLALLAELREALNGRGQLDLLLQPAVALDTGAPIGVEAFVRWNHPRRGTLRPVDFVRVVEQSELLGSFTRHVLDRALAVARKLDRNGVPLPISVNLSPRSLFDRQLPADIGNLLTRYRVTPERLILEITETVVLSSDRVVDDVLAALRQLGVGLAIDDFGTGCSALTFLTRVPVDEVKVDRTFVARMVESPEAAAIVRTTVALGRELGVRVVAEGVETAEQRKALVHLGCPAAQGFHFFRPMPAGKLVDALQRAAATPGKASRRLRAAD